MDEKFVADIVPMDIFVASKNSKQVRDELNKKGDVEMTLSITEMTESMSYGKSSNLTIFGNDSFEIKNHDIITFYDSRRVTHRADDVSIIVLIAISGTAIMTAFGIAIASVLYRRRRRFCIPSKAYRQAKSSFFAPETESHTWDSLSFSCSVADFSTSKIQFRSLESLSDDSYINSLDEAISYKASIAHSDTTRHSKSLYH
ncbi:Proline--tRNA ligase [Dirofilaria immitis]